MMRAYTEAERAALIEYSSRAIKQAEENRDEIPFGLSEEEEMETSLFELALAALTAEPVGSFHISAQQVQATTDYVKDGEWPIDDGELKVFATPPVAALILPEELPYPFGNFSIGEVAQWNACIEEVKRLNATAPAEEEK